MQVIHLPSQHSHTLTSSCQRHTLSLLQKSLDLLIEYDTELESDTSDISVLVNMARRANDLITIWHSSEFLRRPSNLVYNPLGRRVLRKLEQLNEVQRDIYRVIRLRE